MTEKDMEALAEMIDGELPEGMAFALVVFPAEVSGPVALVSNVEHQDAFDVFSVLMKAGSDA